jgi:hypothetical protein
MLACRGNCLRAHFWSREPKNKAKLNRLIGQVFYRGVGEGSRKTRKTPLRGFALRLVLVIRPLLRIDLLPMVRIFPNHRHRLHVVYQMSDARDANHAFLDR